MFHVKSRPPPEKKAEGAQNQGKKAEAAKPTATKVNEGAQNQGKVRELQIKVEIRLQVQQVESLLQVRLPVVTEPQVRKGLVVIEDSKGLLIQFLRCLLRLQFEQINKLFKFNTLLQARKASPPPPPPSSWTACPLWSARCPGFNVR
ncbi:ribosome-binding 1 isoform X1, putative [Babesia ovata]|uniref:Ribosome-binding 1 isoform X1, putative n=1 Tax=Babesia ovata TaxID=189622 RepID=A0A2H6KG12_9APIC|nr:ribosome-binding 1 isoform X1, putative [Babesia ovata]GBE61899.1 ribosome-binding 1 isoform X1, putative [Babesia ovata]